MRLKKFQFFSPASLGEALSLLEEHGEQAKVIAGGTDLVVQMKNKLLAPEQIISLLRIKELSGLNPQAKALRIGALTRHSVLESSPLLQGELTILAQAAAKIGSPQIRFVATLGGNLCNASPAADTAPALLVLEAEAGVAGRKGERRVPLESFFTGPGLTALNPGEILKEILLPPLPANTSGAYLKLGRRRSLDLALVGVAVLLTVHPRTRVCQRARVALGAVAPRPLRAKETEKLLEGKVLEEKTIREAGRLARSECRPISDLRASAEYRREMVAVLVERAIKKSLGLPIPPTGI